MSPTPSESFEAEALRILRAIAGPRANFHENQLEAIDALVNRRARTLVVQRTGWGKSAVYFVATKMLRDRDAGPTLLISPLLALMRNQIEMAERAGIKAHTINSSNREEHEAVISSVQDDEVDILLISPERLNNAEFRQEVLGRIAERTGLLVVDEAHCISDWGHDFRPDYRRVVNILNLLPRGVPILATTATANDRVVKDIEDQLGGDLITLRGSLERESLSLHALAMPAQSARLAWLSETIPDLAGSGIVYTLTIRDAEVVAQWLASEGINAVPYHGDVPPEQRLQIERDLLKNDVKVVVATSALGMGFDKPDISFVIHYQSPGSAIAYYQQVGRAGRAVDEAVGVLLAGEEDKDIQDFFIRTAFPVQLDAESALRVLEDEADVVSLNHILSRVNVRRGRLEKLMKLLEVEGAVERVDGGYRRTLNPWSYDAARVERITQQRRDEQAAMADYRTTEQCLMKFLRAQLDDVTDQACGRCMNCGNCRFDEPPSRTVVRAAAEFLRSREFIIEPRLMWPSGLDEPRGRIPVELRMQEGRCLSLYNDGGWGKLVRQGKTVDGHFADELVDASAELIARRWQPEATWITCIPSLQHPELVPSFAERLAQRLELPFVGAIAKARATQPQKEMENSHSQIRNIWGAFEIAGPLPSGAVLLVDDMVDSKWTLTVASHALLEAGSGPVYPFALSNSAGRT